MKKYFLAIVIFAISLMNLPSASATSVPTGLKVGNSANASGEALVEWNSVSGATGYQVKQVSDVGTVYLSTTTNSITASSLVMGKSYSFSVAAVDSSATWSDYSSSVSFVGQGKPIAPTNLIATASKGAVVLTWTPGSSTPSISSYSITSDDPTVSATVSDGSATQYTVSNLVNGKSYVFSIKAANSIGNSSTVSFSKVTTPVAPGSPGTPSTSISGQSITVTWTAPTDDGGSTVTGYTVYQDKGGTVTSYPSGTTSYTFTNLDSGTYSFSVSATNGVGDSPKSNSSGLVNIGSKTAQTLSWTTAPSATKLVKTTEDIEASTDAIGLTVSYSFSPSTVCSKKADTASGVTVDYKTPGTCTITVTQSGDGTYASANPLQKEVTVQGQAQTITWAGTEISGTKYVNDVIDLLASTSSPLVVTYEVSGSCTIATAKLTLSSSGTCTVTAKQAGDSDYSPAANVVKSFTVSKKTPLMAWTTEPASTKTVTDADFNAIASTNAGVTVSYKTSSTSCQVSGAGSVKLLSSGECVIEAYHAATSAYLAGSLTKTVTVDGITPTITWTTTVPTSKTVGDADITLGATTDATSATVLYRTASTACSISGASVTFISAGSCVVEAYHSSTSRYKAGSKTSTITVAAAAATATPSSSPAPSGGGGGSAVASPSPSTSASASPSPSATPRPTISSSPLPSSSPKPSTSQSSASSPSASASTSASASPANSIAAVLEVVKQYISTTNVTVKPSSTVSVSTSANYVLTSKVDSPFQIKTAILPKGTSVKLVLTTPNGKNVTLTNTNKTVTSSYKSPALNPEKPGTYTFKLTIGKVTKVITVKVVKK